jgi:hypothetical protein
MIFNFHRRTRTMRKLQDFMSQFKFDPSLAGCVGVERECFLYPLDTSAPFSNGPVNEAERALRYIHKQTWLQEPDNFWSGDNVQIDPKDHVGYEFSACQLETRTAPTLICGLEYELTYIAERVAWSLENLKLRPVYEEVAPESMPLDVYPDPSGRYKELAKRMSREKLAAACRVIGTHIHIGMPNHKTALRVYNRVIAHTGLLTKIGDGSRGERMRLYRVVKPDCDPCPYESWSAFHQHALASGFADNPRDNWQLVRITKYGTIEFRMFGATESSARVATWAQMCHGLCQ